MKRLIFRLSSLGDIILSQAALEVPYEGESHWVVAKEFEALLQGNPAISRLWVFDREKNPGTLAWIRFLKLLSAENFDLVLDLHATLRTRIAWLLFLFLSPRTGFRKLSKERLRRVGYISLKRFWPKMWRPHHLSEKSALLAGGSGKEKPDLRWMLNKTSSARAGKHGESPLQMSDDGMLIALAPSSAWKGKEWPTNHYLSWLKSFRMQNRDARFILLGTLKDRASLHLRDLLLQNGVPFVDGIGKYSLHEAAKLLSRADLVVGADTGLLHLAEAVGTAVVTIFGPTRSDFGFGPRGEKSKAIDSPLWCSPCSKDGSLCFRVKDRYKCLKVISPDRVALSSRTVLENEPESFVRSALKRASAKQRGTGAVNLRKSLSIRLRMYSGFFRLFFDLFGRLLVGAERWQETITSKRKFIALHDHEKRHRRIWFHAASVGELESLWSLVEFASTDPALEVILTVFSSSAWSHLHRMSRKLEGRAPLYVGYSPLEGDWGTTIEALSPDFFITAKYEAWPEMWNALAESEVPLAIIGAKPRSSLLWAKRILKALRGRIPEIIFFSFDAENRPGLAEAFPQADILLGSDPRWDRVFHRSKDHHPRVSELQTLYSDLPRPWGVVGSAWATDLARFPRDAFESIPGTIWIVPHKVDPKSISEIEILVRERGWTPVRTGNDEKIRPAGKIAVLVDEMGFLAELYSLMDWSFVGGGFGTSIHSTIEPSVYGLPIIGGPHGREKFDEITLLEKQGQLRILEEAVTVESFARLVQGISQSTPLAQKKKWTDANRQHQGASQRIWSELRSRMHSNLHGD